MRGRGRNSKHAKRTDGHNNELPTISIDYHFMSQEEEKANKNPLLVMTDDKLKTIFARAAGEKGVGSDGALEWLIVAIVAELDAWGYRGQDIVLKCDQENAIEALRKAVSELRSGRSVPEASPKGESKANG